MPSAPLIFLCYIVLEIYLLVQAVGIWGGWTVLLLLGLGFLSGAFILQHNRARILSGNPGSVLRLVFSSLAGVLLIIPGFVSDIIAILLLLPPVQSYAGKSSDRFFMRQGFSKLFRFGYFGNMNFPGSGFPNADAPDAEPEFREDIKVTVIDREDGSSSERTISRRRKIDDSDIIDVDPDDTK